ncbi:GNAT family N-acetyltransferase [Bacillus sp. FJAT-49736]|uniref:GNAT family N-acetyltransferase n=1 Tax=Bacillus sp. FJAT-49736 TaxID=2833582 RepID=UPI001BC9D626|nr:GNAT family N-acetyltransferase [Bacillus sp. FJAT-49736]MBS4174506.1 GNAT family N-acetyltransferase [Bacillus sp. FJAT-49736]
MSIIVEKELIKYQRCTKVDMDLIYTAFSKGFSDYIIKMEIPKDVFVKNFFGPEGNSLEHSFIATYDGEPIGVILGGIKLYEGIKTMRCGTLAISPDFRGKEVSKKLFELHKEEAISQGCKQLFLEVIVGNDRAINFYKKLGYEKIYNLPIFSLGDLSQLPETKKPENVTLQKISFSDYEKATEKWDYHINWQNDVDFIRAADNYHFYGAYVGNEMVGCLSINGNGRISFLMVEKSQRRQGIGLALLNQASKDLNVKTMSTTFPNNHQLEGFFKRSGFTRNALSQYEMYYLL